MFPAAAHAPAAVTDSAVAAAAAGVAAAAAAAAVCEGREGPRESKEVPQRQQMER